MQKLIFTCLAMLLLVSSVNSQTVTQWRGTDRRGVYNESNLLKSWPAEGPQLLWSTDQVGNGYGSPAITSDRLYITGEKDSLAYLFAYDLKGTLLWKTDFGKEWTKTYGGSRSTPTIVDNLIYVCSGMGNLSCLDAKTGAIKWSVNFKNDLHGKLPMFGFSESPLIDGEKVFLTPGGKDTSVVAINRFTGKTIWVCKGNGEAPAYNSPVMIKLPARQVLVTFTAYAMLGVDAKTGELLWSHEQINTPLNKREPGNGDTHSNSIWYENGFIYYIAGDGNCAVKLELSKDGKQIKQLWRNPLADNFMGGFIKIDNRIYSCTNNRRDLKCLDANTGQYIDSLKMGIGNIISADKMLYYYNQKGDVSLISPDADKMKMISTFKITKGSAEHFSHPVIANGVYYIRHGKALMAYKIK